MSLSLREFLEYYPDLVPDDSAASQVLPVDAAPMAAFDGHMDDRENNVYVQCQASAVPSISAGVFPDAADAVAADAVPSVVSDATDAAPWRSVMEPQWWQQELPHIDELANGLGDGLVDLISGGTGRPRAYGSCRNGHATRQASRNPNRRHITCHQPPFQITNCNGAIGDGVENLGGTGGRQCGFLCHKCHTRWSQLTDFDLPDPNIKPCKKLSRSEREATDVALRGSGYNCGECKRPKVFKPELAAAGVSFCNCRCPICNLYPKKCKCKELVAGGIDQELLLPPMVPPLTQAPIPRSLMVGGGGASLTTMVQSTLASAQAVMTAAKQTVVVQAVAVSGTDCAPLQQEAAVVEAATHGATCEETMAACDAVENGNAQTASRSRYGGKGPSFVRHVEKEGRLGSDETAEIVCRMESAAAVATEAPKAPAGPAASEGAKRTRDDDAKEDARAHKRIKESEETAAAVIEAPKAPAAPKASEEAKCTRDDNDAKEDGRVQRSDGAASNAAKAREHCEACNRAHASIRCKHKNCMARVCSARCAGYHKPKYLKEAGGWTCRAHRASEDDHAWFCPMCKTMVTDRGDHVIVPSIGCDKCDRWFCHTCVGFHKGARFPRTWHCADCRA